MTLLVACTSARPGEITEPVPHIFTPVVPVTSGGASVGAAPTPSVSASVVVEDVKAPCPDLRDTAIQEMPLKMSYSVNGYFGRTLHLRRDGEQDEHCLVVAWPPGKENSAGKPSQVAARLDAAWFRAIENTLARIPWTHVQALHRIVIDNQPLLHGLAAFDRQDPTDGRDGHTIWLNEHLFVDGDHWVRANVGSYFSYHSNEAGKRIHGQPADHELFSPVLLHEIGHIVMYNLINPKGEEAATPECASSCGDLDAGCTGLTKTQKEAGCISPYCRPHRFPGSTENWAELYRFFYQSSHTRTLLSKAGAHCLELLAQHDEWPNAVGTWPFGLPDDDVFRPSRWDSCGGRACKGW